MTQSLASTASSQQDISQHKGLLYLMAIACGLCAGGNYFSQPLISTIQQYYQITAAQAAFNVSLAQIAYAIGLLLIVPLGDLVNKTKFIPMLMVLTALGLFICAFAINIEMLWFGTIVVGLFSVAAQVLIPLAAIASNPDKMGEVVGTLMSGLLVGLLISTSLSGLLSNLFHWQMIYFISAIMMLFLAAILKPRLPHVASSGMPYLDIFRSMGKLLLTQPRLIRRALIGACVFAAMSTLFSTIAVLLTAPPFQLSNSMIGALTLVGVFGALATARFGRWADQGHAALLTALGLISMLASWLFLYWGGQSLLSYILGYGLISLGLVLVHSSNQSIIFRLGSDAKSRINSIYMTLYFTGGATGSSLGIYAWHHGGWWLSCLMGMSWVCIAICIALYDQYSTQKSLKKIA